MADIEGVQCNTQGHRYEPARTLTRYGANEKDSSVQPSCTTAIYAVYCTKCGKAITIEV